MSRAWLTRAWRHGLFEAARIARNGEQLLLNLVLPAAFAAFGSRFAHLATGTVTDREQIVAPGAIAIAIASAAFTSQAIHTGFERKYGSMRLLGSTPLGGSGLVAGKTIAVALIVAGQVAVLATISAIRGWRPDLAGIGWGALLALLAIACFVALALIIAGTVKPELNLGLSNLLWVAMVAAGGLVIPLAFRQTPGAEFMQWLPSGALGEGLRDTLASGAVPLQSLLVLAVWAAALSITAAHTFRWSSRS